MRHPAFGAAALAVCLMSTIEAPAQVFGTDPGTGRDAIHKLIREKGEATVIVRIDVDDYVPEGRLQSVQSRRAQRALIHSQQERILGAVSSGNVRLKRSYQFIPYLALVVDSPGLEALSRTPGVALIQPEIRGRPDIGESRVVVGANVANAAGCDGSGWSVAVLDSGVDLDHDAFAGKIVAEACFSTHLPASSQESMCPGDVTESTAAGSGDDCANGEFPGVICPHGSLVAGVAAGNDPGGIVGVAPEAGIISIRVQTEYTDGADCPGPAFAAGCPLINISDLMAAIEHVGELSETTQIAAINLSVDLTLLPDGPVSSASACDGVAALSGIKDAVDFTNSLGIPSVASTGNQDLIGSINPPSCLSNVISVGYTQDGSTFGTGTVVDAIGLDPNRASFMDFWAPGEWITSAWPTNSTLTVRGTSVAAPHVSGAIAALRSKGTASDPDYYVDLLKTTGVMVTDVEANPDITKPRIDVGAACAALEAISLDATVLLEGPYAGSGLMSVPGEYVDEVPLTQPFEGAEYAGTAIEFAGNQTVVALPANTVDWVLVELRTATGPESTVAQTPAFVTTDGSVVSPQGGPVGFLGIDPDAYYVVIRHRNHADVMSSSAVDFSPGSASWNFTTGLGQAFTAGGTAMKSLGDGLFGMFAADANVDAQVTAPDFNLWNAATTAGATGYQSADHNLDGQVTAPDFNLWNANTTAGASSRVPD
ncbi:MAG TPA: S8 family serine peptidase [Rhodothermia bacterium]